MEITVPRLRIRTLKEIESRKRDEMIISELAALRSHASHFEKEVKWENEREREALQTYDWSQPVEWNKTPSYEPTQVDSQSQILTYHNPTQLNAHLFKCEPILGSQHEWYCKCDRCIGTQSETQYASTFQTTTGDSMSAYTAPYFYYEKSSQSTQSNTF